MFYASPLLYVETLLFAANRSTTSSQICYNCYKLLPFLPLLEPPM